MAWRRRRAAAGDPGESVPEASASLDVNSRGAQQAGAALRRCRVGGMQALLPARAHLNHTRPSSPVTVKESPLRLARFS